MGLINHRNCGHAPIGLFDSGVGGLTVLRQLEQQLPNESVLYLGDTARLPYGTKTPEQILQYVREILTWMTAEGAKLVIMACNTSSALALETVRSEFSIPILGLILPGAKAAVQAGQRIGVIATQATVASHAYPNAVREINPNVAIWQVACPEFVPLIEQNQLNTPYTIQVAQRYLAPLLEQQIDTLVYGCTHYPYLEPVLRQILAPEVQLVDPAKAVVTAAAQELDLLSLRHLQASAHRRIGVTGDPQSFARVARHCLGYTPVVEQICLPTRLLSQAK